MKQDGMFRDEAVLHVRAGKGGDGCCSFHREKYVTQGGPDGGDGGDGGNVVFVATSHENSLFRVARQREHFAEHGRPGGPNNCSGAQGESIEIRVPIGTQIKDARRGNLLADLKEDGEQIVIAEGGRGGKGNARFASATHQTPDRFDKGTPGEDRQVALELKLVANVGFVGLPNAGKSTLLRTLTSARPRVGAYPFTTLDPSLGVMETGADPPTLVLADIPGLIEGANEGKGLGHQFLRHVERTQVLLHLVDCSVASEDPWTDFQTIRQEITAFSLELSQRSWLLLATKIEDDASRLRAQDLMEKSGQDGLMISAAMAQGLDALRFRLAAIVKETALRITSEQG